MRIKTLYATVSPVAVERVGDEVSAPCRAHHKKADTVEVSA